MITESTLYWITRLDSIRTFIIVLIALSAVAGVVAFFASMVFTFDDEVHATTKVTQQAWTTTITLFATSIMLGIVLVLTPTTKEMAMIKVIPAIANGEAAERIKTDFGDLYRMAIDCAKEKLKGERK